MNPGLWKVLCRATSLLAVSFLHGDRLPELQSTTYFTDRLGAISRDGGVSMWRRKGKLGGEVGGEDSCQLQGGFRTALADVGRVTTANSLSLRRFTKSRTWAVGAVPSYKDWGGFRRHSTPPKCGVFPCKMKLFTCIKLNQFDQNL